MSRFRVRLAAAVAALLLGASGLRADDWRVARHDPQRTGQSAGRIHLPSATVQWRHYLGGSLGAQQYALTDIDRDGVTDVVFVSAGKVIAKHADDTLVWETALIDARSLSALTDLDGDGAREVVVTADRGNVLVLDGLDGRVRWELPQAQRGLGGQVRVGDVDGDGGDELVVGQCVRNPLAALAVSFRGGLANPRELWRIAPLPDACGTVGDVIGDLDGDGAPEMVMALGHDHMRVFDGRTGALAIDLRAPESGLFGTFSTPLLREIDGRPGHELVVVTNGYSAVPSPFGARRVAVFRHAVEGGARALRLVWEANGPDRETGSVAFEDRSVADLDGDGVPEMTFSFYDGVARRWSLETRDARTGALRARRVSSELVGVRDLDGDGRPEALAVESDRSTVILRWEAGGWAPRWSLEGRRPARSLDINHAARERTATRPLLVALDDDPGAELILAPFDPDLPPEQRVVTSLEAWDLAPQGLRLLGRIDAPTGTTVLTASSGEALSRPYAQPVVVTSDGYLLALDREMASTNRIVTAEFTVPGMRVGGYFSGSGVSGHTPVVGSLAPQGDRAIIVRDARPALVRLDARGASLSSPPQTRWSRPRSAFPSLVDLDADGSLEVAAVEGRDVVALSLADGSARWTARDVAPRGSSIVSDPVPLRLADGSAQIALLRGDPNVRLRPVVLAARDGSVRWNELTRGTSGGFGQLTVADLDGDRGDELIFAANVLQHVDGATGRVIAEGPNAPYGVQIVAPFRGRGPEVFASAAARPDRLIAADMSLLSEGALEDFSSPYGAVVRCAESLRVALSPIGTSELRLIDPANLSAAGGVIRRIVLAGGLGFTPAETLPAGLRGGSFANLTAVRDLDGTGAPGLLVGSTDGHLYALDACAFSLRWSLDFRYPVGEPVVADTNGDGVDEVLVSVGDGYLYALGPRTLSAASEVLDLTDERGAVDVDQVESATTVFARWSAVPGATSYHVRVLTASGTALRFPDYVEIQGTSARIDGLPMRSGGRYRVGVVPVSPGGSGAEALSDGFTVVDLSPPTVEIDVLTPRFAPASGERAEIELRFTDRTGLARVSARVRDERGAVITTLDDETLRSPQPARTTRASWTGADDATRVVAPLGVYEIVAEATDVEGRSVSARAQIELVAPRARGDAGVSARDPSPRGCGCRAQGAHGASWSSLLVAAALLRRRRREVG